MHNYDPIATYKDTYEMASDHNSVIVFVFWPAHCSNACRASVIGITIVFVIAAVFVIAVVLVVVLMF